MKTKTIQVVSTLIIVCLFGMYSPSEIWGNATQHRSYVQNDYLRADELASISQHPTMGSSAHSSSLADATKDNSSLGISDSTNSGKKDTYIVQFKSTTTKEYIDELLCDYDYTVIGSSDQKLIMLSVLDINDFEQKFHLVIEYYESNRKHIAANSANDPYFNEQWGLTATEVPAAWDISTGNTSQTSNPIYVAVIDSGIDRSHPDLDEADIRLGWDYVSEGHCNWDSTGHGTSIIGVIAAETNNGMGISGICWDMAIIPLRVFYSDGTCYTSDIVQAIYDAADVGCKVINMSLGSNTYSVSFENALQYASSKGCIIVASAGNDGNSEYVFPASYEDVISVGSVNPDLSWSSFSNYNNMVDICAPGAEIVTTFDALYAPYSNYVIANGTSYSTAYVSGIAALAACIQPNLTPQVFQTILYSTSQDLGAIGYDNYFGNGLICASNLLSEAMHDPYPEIRSFVTRFYQQCLAREPDSYGLNVWINNLAMGIETGSSVAYGFVFSAEFVSSGISNEEYVSVMYRAFFNRDPDSVGFNDWVGKLNSGYSRYYVLAGFINSQEFINLAIHFGITPGNIVLSHADYYPDVAAYVSRFYQQCLGRTPDGDGLDNWVKSLVTGTETGASVAYGFVFSQEFINQNTSNDAYVTTMYTAFFNRPPDPTGFATWTDYLEKGYERYYILKGFVHSVEFRNLCESYGITCGSLS